MPDFAGQNWVVMGLGAFGGGLGVARYLADNGASVLVTDQRDEASLRPQLARLAELTLPGSIRTRLGRHEVEDFAAADGLVVNPAVPKPWQNPFIAAAAQAGARIESEITLALARHAGKTTLAITGSAGKSTTTAAACHVLNTIGIKAIAGGNLGGSLLTDDRIAGADALVVELSSAQLYWIDRVRPAGFRPAVTMVTNLVPNHLDWHETADHYRTCKQHLPLLTKDGGTAILGPTLREWQSNPDAERVIITKGLEGCSLPGVHNALNLAMASAGACAIARSIQREIDVFDANDAASSFQGLPHRLCLVSSALAARWYDDSKSTVPEATQLAVDALASAADARIHLIAGGYDKGVDLTPIARLSPRLASLHTIGATGRAIASASAGIAQYSETLERAVATIAAQVRAGDIVLLSPGCASWDQFESFEQRGRLFAELASSLEHATPPAPTTTAVAGEQSS